MLGIWRRKPPVPKEEVVDLSSVPSIFERPEPPPLALFTLGELIPAVWCVRGADGALITDTVRFLPDGRALGKPGEPSARWEQVDGRLIVAGEAGEVIWTFERRDTRAGRNATIGHWGGSDDEVAMTHNVDDLQTVHSLRWPSQPLLVVFNSWAHAFDGQDTRWEFSECMREGGVDLVLVAERADPGFAYLNKTGRVLDRLRCLPAAGYRELLLLGQGSGGFAAMLFAELLSYEFPDCRIRSVTINALTTHGSESEAAIRAASEPGMLPAFIDTDALSQKDCPVAGIRDLVRISTRRRSGIVEHRVLYDEGNPAQAYYAHTVDDLSGFVLQPAALGLPHEEGIAAIRGSNAFQSALAWGREADA